MGKGGTATDSTYNNKIEVSGDEWRTENTTKTVQQNKKQKSNDGMNAKQERQKEEQFTHRNTI